ncbi:MAG: hypothetical protein ACLQJR_05455 [Stellaceae bacterium]
MPSSDKTPKTSPSSAKKPDEIARVRDVERDPGAILRRAEKGPVRVTSNVGNRTFHVATVRRGDRNDPAWQASLPVTIAALKRRTARILHLASGLQITLRVQARKNSADTFFVEPGSECLEFATMRMGGSSRDTAPLRNALRRTQIARRAVDTAAAHVEARWQSEVKSLQNRIVTLERAAKKHADLAAALKKSETALKDVRLSQRAAEAAAKKSAADKNEEVQALKNRIIVLERSLKKQTALREADTNAISARIQPNPEISPSSTVESGSPGPHQL